MNFSVYIDKNNIPYQSFTQGIIGMLDELSKRFVLKDFYGIKLTIFLSRDCKNVKPT